MQSSLYYSKNASVVRTGEEIRKKYKNIVQNGKGMIYSTVLISPY